MEVKLLDNLLMKINLILIQLKEIKLINIIYNYIILNEIILIFLKSK